MNKARRRNAPAGFLFSGSLYEAAVNAMPRAELNPDHGECPVRMRAAGFVIAALCALRVPGPGILPLQAHEYSAGQLVIAHPWAPPTLGRQRIGVVYFTIRNAGAEGDRLLGIDLPQGGQAQMHISELQDGVMRMRPVDMPVIPAHGLLALEPGGMHVMLGDLPGPLLKGGRLPLILHFEKAGQVLVEAAIEARQPVPAQPSHQGH